MRQFVAVVLVLLGCAACTSAASQPPVPQSSHPPTAPVSEQGTASPPSRAHPIKLPVLHVTWTPNLNWTHQKAATTHGTTAQGRALVRDIRAAKRVPHNGAAYSCPIDFGVHARFSYGPRHGDADLGGCRFVRLGHHSYWTDRAIVRDLRALAPHRWLPYLKLRGLK